MKILDHSGDRPRRQRQIPDGPTYLLADRVLRRCPSQLMHSRLVDQIFPLLVEQVILQCECFREFRNRLCIKRPREVATCYEIQPEERSKIVVDNLDIDDRRLCGVAVNAFDEYRAGVPNLSRGYFHASTHADNAVLAGEPLAERFKLRLYLIGYTRYGNDLLALHTQTFVEKVSELVVGNERTSDQQD